MNESFVIKDLETNRYFTGYIWDLISSWSNDLERANMYSSKEEAQNDLSDILKGDYAEKLRGKYLQIIPLIIMD